MSRVTDAASGRYVQYTSSGSNDYAVPSVITPNGDSALAQNFTWNAFLGLTQETGPNGATASMTYDANARPATTTSAHGAVTTLAYTNAPPTVTATTNGKWVKTTSDGLGRTIKVERGDGTGTKTIVDTEYEPCACSPMGKMKRVSLPYAPGGTVYWTVYNYDGVGRTISVVAPGGSGTTTYLYEGNAVTVTDAAGKWRKYESDAFGNVTKTIEPNPAGGANWETTFAYNVVGQRTSMTMVRGAVTQVRSWNFNGTTLRLTSETHPESGTTSYTYTSAGQLLTKTNAAGGVVTFSYDGLGRTSTITDSANGACSNAAYTYDIGVNAVGRLVKVQWGSTGCSIVGRVFKDEFEYTAAGLVTKKKSGLGTLTPLELNYTYNNEGQMTWMQDGARSYTFAYDSLGRASGMTGSATVSNISYNAADQMLSITHGGVAETRTYNERLQLTRITVAGQMDVEYRYSATQNNGQITAMKNWINGEEVNYSYDALGRLASAATTGTEWGLSFAYDGFGNKTGQTVTKGSAPGMSVAMDASNHVVGHTYDSAGNTISMPTVFAMTWDAMGRMQTSQVSAVSGIDGYLYDPSNRRVWRSTASGNTFYFRGLGGEIVGEYAVTISGGGDSWSLVKTNVWFAGRKVGRKEDRLGTVSNGNRFYPYGEESGTPGSDPEKFATYTRDGGTGLDYAVNRYYASGIGRFTSPDPYRGSATAARSGSWNRYAYVEGDPVGANDPSGLMQSKGKGREDEDDFFSTGVEFEFEYQAQRPVEDEEGRFKKGGAGMSLSVETALRNVQWARVLDGALAQIENNVDEDCAAELGASGSGHLNQLLRGTPIVFGETDGELANYQGPRGPRGGGTITVNNKNVDWGSGTYSYVDDEGKNQSYNLMGGYNAQFAEYSTRQNIAALPQLRSGQDVLALTLLHELKHAGGFHHDNDNGSSPEVVGFAVGILRNCGSVFRP